MKKLANKYGILFVILTCIPMAMIINVFAKTFHINSHIIICIQIPFILIQLFSLFVMIKYSKEVFK